MYCAEGIEGVEILALAVTIRLMEVQSFGLEMICDEEVVDDVVLVQRVLWMVWNYGIVGHIVHLGVDILLLVTGSV